MKGIKEETKKFFPILLVTALTREWGNDVNSVLANYRIPLSIPCLPASSQSATIAEE
jgi:hypothetical protein